MMAFELVGKALRKMGLGEPLPHEPVEGVCCISGESGPCIERKLLIGESFTTQGTFKAPDSEWVSIYAWYAFKLYAERAGNWYCDVERFVPMDRAEARAMILSGFSNKKLPWAMYVTTSFKKHGSLVAPVNQPGGFAIGFETQIANCYPELVGVLNEDLLYWQKAGIVRSDLQRGSIFDTRVADPAAIMHFNRNCPGKLPLYQVLAYLLPGKQAVKEVSDGD